MLGVFPGSIVFSHLFLILARQMQEENYSDSGVLFCLVFMTE